MSIWKSFEKAGRTSYLKDRKFIGADKVPDDVKEMLKPGIPLDDSVMSTPFSQRVCVFCGAESKMSRLVNGQTVYICDEHYYDKTIGQIAEVLRK